MSNYLLISDAAKEVKVESHVLRYWEEELHLSIKRNELGHRYYTQEDVERFKQIKGMKERGLQLKAIKMILRDGRLDVLPQPDETEEIQGIAIGEGEAAMGKASNAVQGALVSEEPGSMAEVFRGEDTSTVPSGIRGEGANSVPGIFHGEKADMMQENRAKGTTITDSSSTSHDMAEDGSTMHNHTENEREGFKEPYMAIDIVNCRPQDAKLAEETRDDKSKRLQWLLQQLIRETLRENNHELSQEIKESVIKELDYQFRSREEREEEREKRQDQRNEEYYRKMDELLRKKARGPFGGKSRQLKSVGKNQETAGGIAPEKGNGGRQEKNRKKKRHSI